MDYLTWPDYLILVTFLVISLGIGVYHSLTGGRQKTTAEFIMANRALKVFPTAMSLFVSFQAASKILGYPAEIYSYGPQFMIMALVSYTLSLLLAMHVTIPWLYPMKLVSVNEYIERRYQAKSARIFAAALSVFAMVLVSGTVMYAPSAALESATGLPIAVSIPLMGVVSIVYTALGGMRAVIWTDVFQTFVMIGGLLAILIKGLIVVGGFGNMFRLCSQSGRLNWADFSPDPTVRHTVWGFVFGYTSYWFSVLGISQSAVQRYSATKTQTKAQLTAALNIPAVWGSILLLGFTGLTVVSYYASISCDPLANHEISNANQLLTHFVLKLFSDIPGAAGLFLATLYAASLSTVSSHFSSAAANCWEDMLQWKLMHWTESRKALLNRFLVVLIGFMATGMAFLASAAPGPITQITASLDGAIRGPLCGMFLLGGLNRYANWKGALTGGIISLIGSLWLTIGSYMLKRRHPTLPSLSIDGCLPTMMNFTSSNYDDANSSSIFHFPDESSILPVTMKYLRPQINETIEISLHGLDQFYSISYLWHNILWILVTIFVGSVASFLLRDESLEESVGEELLINVWRFFKCGSDQESKSRTEKVSYVSCVNLGDTPRENIGETEEVVPALLPSTTQCESSPSNPLKRTGHWRVRTQKEV